MEEALRQVGTIKRVLILNKFQSGNQGISRDFWNINLKLSPVEHLELKNSEISVVIEAVEAEGTGVLLIARPAELC